MIRLFFTILILLQCHVSWATVRSFDGTDDEVDMGNVLDVTTENVSICAWSNLSDDASGDHLIGKKNNDTVGSAGYQIRQISTDTARSLFSDGTAQVSSDSTTDIDGAWYFVCATWDGTNNVAILYINSVQEDTDTATTGSLTNAVNFGMGQEGNNGSDVNGLLAYGIQSTSILTLVEITEFMWKPDSLPSGGFWPMYGGDSPEQDLSGNNNDGTVSGATTNAGGPPVMIGDAPV